MKKVILIAAIFAAVVTLVQAEIFFKEEFGEGWEKRWIQSESKPDYGIFDVSAGKWFGDEKRDAGLQTTQDARFYSISAKFPEKNNKDKPLIIQFTVKHEQGIDCGGGYLKILPAGIDPKEFNGDSPYAIMFGPDICGGTKRGHLIFNYKGNNLNWKKNPGAKSDELTHLYTLIVRPDNTYEMHIDQERREMGKLAEDWDFLKEPKIPDPEAKKPEDWVDDAQIPDPTDEKPEGYDDIPQQIPDPKAEIPKDWDVEEDGEWEPPMIDNPEFKGEWKPKMIPNPKFKGVWTPPMIPNPEYVADDELYLQKSIAMVGIDIWQVKSGSIFDNIFIGDDIEEAEEFAEKTYTPLHEAELKLKEKHDEEERVRKEAEEAKRKAEEAAKAPEPEPEKEEKKEETWGDAAEKVVEDVPLEDVAKDEL